MRSMYQNDGQELVKLLQKVKRAGTAVSLDMAAVDPGTEPGRTDWKTILEKTLPFVDFFMPSAEELCYMLDRERFYPMAGESPGRRRYSDPRSRKRHTASGRNVHGYGMPDSPDQMRRSRNVL